MSNNKKLSSIEWLIDNLYLKDSIKWIEIMEQAKAMHREEIIDATCLNAYVNEDDREIGEHYYNETYGGEQ